MHSDISPVCCCCREKSATRGKFCDRCLGKAPVATIEIDRLGHPFIAEKTNWGWTRREVPVCKPSTTEEEE